ncbi:MAG: cytochrome P450, partial [Solirubrobacterales bacterium]|nr:cytochrome P450 [Solirubrobacterales bacterium]
MALLLDDREQADGARPATSGARRGGAGEEPPALRWPALAQTLAWALAPTWAMDHWARACGEEFTISFFPSGRRFTVVSSPEAVKDLFTAPGEVAPSAAGNSPIAGVMGPNSVLTLTGPAHLRQRRLLLPPFHGERMREYEAVIVEATRADMASWPIGRPMRVTERTRAITFEVILRAVFGVEADRMVAMRRAIGALVAPMHTVEALRVALSRPRAGRPGGSIGAALDRVDAVI